MMNSAYIYAVKSCISNQWLNFLKLKYQRSADVLLFVLDIDILKLTWMF